MNLKRKKNEVIFSIKLENEKLVKSWYSLLITYKFEVDAFCYMENGRYVFHFSEIGDLSKLNAIDCLKDERSQLAFLEDKKWLDWADVCLLILPAGKSSHLEAGYAKGCKKKLIIWQEEFPKGEFDVMYGFADLITNSMNEVLTYLKMEEEKTEE